MRQSTTRQLIGQIKRLKNDIHTLVFKPESVAAMEIRIKYDMNQTACNLGMIGSRFRTQQEQAGLMAQIKFSPPCSKAEIDDFVEKWKSQPVHVYPSFNFIPSLIRKAKRDAYIAVIRDYMSDDKYQQFISLSIEKQDQIIEDATNFDEKECQACHIKNAMNESTSVLYYGSPLLRYPYSNPHKDPSLYHDDPQPGI